MFGNRNIQGRIQTFGKGGGRGPWPTAVVDPGFLKGGGGTWPTVSIYDRDWEAGDQ